MKKNEIEKALKRFLKRKITFSLSVLTAFMITGEIVASKEVLPEIVPVEEEVVDPREGSSTQIFFNFDYWDWGSKKDRTDSQFSRTLGAGADKNLLVDGNGVVVDTTRKPSSGTVTPTSELIVKPDIDKTSETTLPSIDMDFTLNVDKPSVNIGKLPTAVEPPKTILPVVKDLELNIPPLPEDVDVEILKPSPLGTITAPTICTETPKVPTVNEPNIKPPAVVPGFNPTIVGEPIPPTAPVVTPPTIPTFIATVGSNANGAANAIDNRSGENSVIDMVAVTAGNFNLTRNSASTWNYTYSGYSGMNAWALGSAGVNNPQSNSNGLSVPANGTWSNLSTKGVSTSSGDQLGFQRVVGNSSSSSGKSTMLTNATFLYTRPVENIGTSLGEFAHLDFHFAGLVSVQRAGLVAATNGLSNQTSILNAYDDAGTINSKNTNDSTNRYAWINSGKIVLEGGNTALTNHYDHNKTFNGYYKALAINTGEVIYQPYYDGSKYYQKYTAGFIMSGSNDSLVQTTTDHIMYNSGSIKTYTGNASLFLSGTDTAKEGRYLSIANKGTLQMYGENSAGIYLKTRSNNNLIFDNPLEIYGDKSIGLYTAYTNGTSTLGTVGGNFKVNIGATGIGNQTFTTSLVSGSTNGQLLTDYNINPSGSSTDIEGTFGIISASPINLTSHEINIYDKTQESVGVYPSGDNGALVLGTGSINLNGGTSNVGVYINGAGSVTSSGAITMTGGEKNIAVYVKGGSSGATEIAKIPTVTATNTTDAIVLYAESGGRIDVNSLNVTSTVGDDPTTTNKKDTGAVFATGSGTVVNIGGVTRATPAVINITGKKLTDANKYVGFGYMATSGATINGAGSEITVTNGSTGAASLGTGSYINLKGGTVTFDGNGYAVYSDGEGKIDLSAGAKLVLKGQSTAFDLDKTVATSPIILDNTSRIDVESNDVVVFNLKNAGDLNTDTLQSSIETYLNTALGSTIDLNTLITSGAGIDNYKIAAVDGGNLTLGDLDKTGTKSDTDPAKKNGYFYYNRFLGQRMKATATDSTITAILNNAQALKFKGQVTGLEMNSSSKATSNDETQINLVNSQLTADRTETGAGAIGIYMNYGKVNIDGSSAVNVENGINAINSNAVGIYAVNGSEVANAGTVNVGGAQSIGILGMAYREQPIGTPIVNEFGTQADQGKVNITNSGTIVLTGDGSVGLYAYNNNTSATAADIKATNTGTITVGNSSGTNTAIGIYGNKNATISNKGTISAGDNGVGIYATSGSTISDLNGTMNLGKDGIGVYLTGDSTIAQNTIADTLTIKSLTGSTADDIGKTGIFYKGTGTENKTVNINVDMSGLTNAVPIYAEKMNLTSSGTLTTGSKGAGIYLLGSASNVAENRGIIKLESTNIGDESAIGMYTKTSNITNSGTINVGINKSTGMYINGTGHKLTNKEGTINLQANETTGIYLDGTDKFSTTDMGTINFEDSAICSVGVYAPGTDISIDDNITFKNKNENKNILFYGKNGADISVTAGKIFTVDGVEASTTDGNKTIGVYLENDGVENVGNSFTGKIDVLNKAVGIYSKDINDPMATNRIDVELIASNKIDDSHKQTIGIYVDGKAEISGTVTAGIIDDAGVTVGIYGDGGEITIGNTGLTLNLNSKEGTGMYLARGAYATGGDIDITNGTDTKNIGLYYRKTDETGGVTHSSNLNLNGSNIIGLYASRGISLISNADITSLTGEKNNIGAYVGTNSSGVGGSEFTSMGNITMNDNGGIGIYVEDGAATNLNGTITLNGGKSDENPSVGMVIQGIKNSDTDIRTATGTNSGTISAGGNIGMYLGGGEGTSKGINLGTINAEKDGGIGVYLNGSDNKFDGTGGEISVGQNGVGIALKGTDAGSVSGTGTLTIGEGGIGIYGENAKLDFDVEIDDNSNKIIGVAASGGSVISAKNIKVNGTDNVGLYLKNNSVTFDSLTDSNRLKITTGGNGTGTSVGLYLDNKPETTKAIPAYNIQYVDIDAGNGVGIYMDGDTTNPLQLTYNDGTITTEGVGIYAKEGNTLNTDNATFNVDGGIGIYLKGGAANVGQDSTKKVTFNLSNRGVGIFNNGGTLNMDPDNETVTVTGEGTLSQSLNGLTTNSGNIDVGTSQNALLGVFDEDAKDGNGLTNTETGTITVTGGGNGLAAIKGESLPTVAVKVINDGVINSSGVAPTEEPSIAIYTDVADVENRGTINVGDKAVGIYADYNGKDIDVLNRNTVMTGTEGIGVYLNGQKGSKITLSENVITSTGYGNTGLVLDSINGSIDAGSITLNNRGKGILVTGNTASTTDTTITGGTIKVGSAPSDDTTLDSAIGILAKDLNGKLTIESPVQITAGDRGIGIYAEGATTTVDVKNTDNIKIGADGVYLYNKGANMNLFGDITADNTIGVVSEGGNLNLGTSSITAKNGGIGLYVKGSVPVVNGTITAAAGKADDYSVGIYYDSINPVGTLPSVIQTGDYNIGVVLDNSSAESSGITLGANGNYETGILAKESGLTVNNGVNITGGIANAAVSGYKSFITANGNIAVSGTSSAGESVGYYLNGGNYSGTGDIALGNYAAAVYAKNLIAGNSVKQTGNTLNAGNNSLGVYAAGTGSGDEKLELTMTGGINLGNSTVGAYGKGVNIVVAGDIASGSDRSVGIVSEGNGDISYSGAMNIGKDSIGIYKLNGSGDIAVSESAWNVGENGYGVYIKQDTTARAVSGVTFTNNADMVLGASAVGIYSSGNNEIINLGDITVGSSTEGLNSVGMFLAAGTTASNKALISVKEDGSVGVYGTGAGTVFTNEVEGSIEVDNSGAGVVVKDGAKAINKGSITLGSNTGASGVDNVGMAAYTGAIIENQGTITINSGTGLVVDKQSQLINSGTLTVNGGKATSESSGGGLTTEDEIEIGSVKITAGGDIVLNNQYTSIGGTFTTEGNLIVNGSYVDVTTGTPVFKAATISGDVRLLPNFALTGNGISYEIKNFINTALDSTDSGTITAVTSPLFVTKITNEGDLLIAKRPYADLTVGDQFDNLDKGLDNILAMSGGDGKDAEILKGLNSYLEGLPDAEFEGETSRKLAEFRGDVYATIQERMQDINRSFDSSFYELESSKNLTNDSNKYSVIYSAGKFKDNTVGIDDYDYDIGGILYMKEREREQVGSKYGFTLGITGAKFKFDDGGSKENVLSLRAGMHNVENINSEYKLSWLSRIDLGYNRHYMKRKLNLHKTYENKADYNSFSIAWDNRISRPIYQDSSRELDIYMDGNLGYGKYAGFKEREGDDGGLGLKIKSNDYTSAQLGAGLKGYQRVYLSGDYSMKLKGDLNYHYEFGDNYSGNDARLIDGEEGYYSLITPAKLRGRLEGTVGVELGREDHMGASFEVTAAHENNRKGPNLRYSVRLHYKFK